MSLLNGRVWRWRQRVGWRRRGNGQCQGENQRRNAPNAYLDGELCGVLPDGRTAFNLIQNASDTGQGSLVFFLFNLPHLEMLANGRSL